MHNSEAGVFLLGWYNRHQTQQRIVFLHFLIAGAGIRLRAAFDILNRSLSDEEVPLFVPMSPDTAVLVLGRTVETGCTVRLKNMDEREQHVRLRRQLDVALSGSHDATRIWERVRRIP